ncbi:RhoGEF domain [Pelomyxa schiedti]|nr:RhoGEF domain [Pelomyxa schiedti]
MEEFWYEELVKSNLIPKQEVNVIFGPIAQYKSLASSMSSEFQKWRSLPASEQKIGGTFLKHMAFFKLYSEHACSREQAQEILETSKKNIKFTSLLETLRKNPIVRGLELSNYLIKPTQRITKYPLLLQDLYKHTDPTHVDYGNLESAIAQMRKMLTTINEATKTSHTIQLLSQLQPNITWKKKVYDLLGSKVHLLLEEKIKCTLSSKGESYKADVAYLFDICILICKVRSNKWFEVGLFLIEDCIIQDTDNDSFNIVVTHRTKPAAIILICPDVHSKQLWLTYLKDAMKSPPNKKLVVVSPPNPQQAEEKHQNSEQTTSNSVQPTLSAPAVLPTRPISPAPAPPAPAPWKPASRPSRSHSVSFPSTPPTVSSSPANTATPSDKGHGAASTIPMNDKEQVALPKIQEISPDTHNSHVGSLSDTKPRPHSYMSYEAQKASQLLQKEEAVQSDSRHSIDAQQASINTSPHNREHRHSVPHHHSSRQLQPQQQAVLPSSVQTQPQLQMSSQIQVQPQPRQLHSQAMDQNDIQIQQATQPGQQKIEEQQTLTHQTHPQERPHTQKQAPQRLPPITSPQAEGIQLPQKPSQETSVQPQAQFTAQTIQPQRRAQSRTQQQQVHTQSQVQHPQQHHPTKTQQLTNPQPAQPSQAQIEPSRRHVEQATIPGNPERPRHVQRNLPEEKLRQQYTRVPSRELSGNGSQHTLQPNTIPARQAAQPQLPQQSHNASNHTRIPQGERQQQNIVQFRDYPPQPLSQQPNVRHRQVTEMVEATTRPQQTTKPHSKVDHNALQQHQSPTPVIHMSHSSTSSQTQPSPHPKSTTPSQQAHVNTSPHPTIVEIPTHIHRSPQATSALPPQTTSTSASHSPGHSQVRHHRTSAHTHSRASQPPLNSSPSQS